MADSTIKSTLSGVIGGLFLGLLVGGYVVVQTHETVIQRDAYKTSLLWEQAETTYVKTTVTAFAITFAFVGALISNATFGSWLRPAVYGILYSFVALIVFTILAAAVTGQQPVNMQKGSSRTIIDVARSYGVFVSIVVGSIAGILGNRWRQARRSPTAQTAE